MKIYTYFVYNSIILFFMLFYSCSGQNISGKITQYTDPSHITGLAKYNDFLYCATKGGLVKWDLLKEEYTIITTANGLPSNILTDVIVDEENRLWVSSLEGLGMFNGTKWEIYGLSNGLPSIEINDLALDRSGKLWVGTADGAAFLERGHFKLLEDEGSPGRKKINYIYFDRGNNIWIGTEQNIYYTMDNVWKCSGREHGLSTGSVETLTQSWDLSIWTASRLGINVWDGGGWVYYSSFENMGTVDVRYLTSTNQRLWVFTANGVYSLRGSDLIQFTKEQGLISNNVTTGLVESDNKIFVGTADGLSIINDGIIKNYAIPNKPVGSNFISISTDEQNRVWLGTWEAGLSLYDSGYWTLLTDMDTNILSTVRSTVFGPDSTIAFNTTSGVAFYKKGIWEIYTRNDGVSGNDVRCGVFDNKGRYWAGTSTGICYFEHGVWKRFRKLNGLPSEDTWSCGVDSKDNVWFGTTDGVVSFVDDKIYDRTSETGFEKPDVRSIHVRDDMIYFGTNDGNLMVYNGDKWDIYSNKYLKTNKGILTITSDSSGALWLGTYGDGIIRINDGKVAKLTMSDGLPFDFVRSIEFCDGILWAACYGGVAKIEL